MMIERVKIRGYRSLYDLEFTPRPLSVLVGPNNAGKSNVIEAISFLSDVYRRDLKTAVDDRGGFDEIRWRRSAGPEGSVAFVLEAHLPLGSHVQEIGNAFDGTGDGATVLDHTDSSIQLAVRHSFTLVPARRSRLSAYVVESEELSVSEAGEEGRRLLEGRRDTNSSLFQFRVVGNVSSELSSALLLTVGSNEQTNLVITQFGVAPTELAMARLRLLSPIVDAFAQAVAGTRVYRLSPTDCRIPGASIAQGELSPGGRNLPTLVAYLQREQPRVWEEVLEAVLRMVPDLEDVLVEQEYDGSLTIRFLESDVSRAWTATEVSDGTIRSIGLLAALFDPRYSPDLIEEPENSLHPWALRVFVDACRKVTAPSFGKQVVLTTHSPVLVDYVRPEDVFVVWRREGRTSLNALMELDPDVVHMWEQGATDLSGLLDSGWVREGVPS
jgi:predicted ATPase